MENSLSNGVIKIFTNEDRPYYDSNDVMSLLGVKQDKAYRIIRSLRKELINDGKLSEAYPCGRVPKRYFQERCYM